MTDREQCDSSAKLTIGSHRVRYSMTTLTIPLKNTAGEMNNYSMNQIRLMRTMTASAMFLKL